MDLLANIKDLKQKIDSMRPLNQGELNELKKWYNVTYTYNSNAIEGNSLTLEETKMVLEEGVTIEGKPLREIFEAVNHSKAIDTLYEFLKSDRDISEEFVKEIHKIILSKIDDENAGIYRKIQVYISGESGALPPANDVPKLMKELFTYCEKESKKKDILELIAEWHYKFVKIHPFVDGNGRVARLIVNMMLLKNNYPIQIIPMVRRREYIQSLHSSNTFLDFYEFFLSVQYENMKDYLRMISN